MKIETVLYRVNQILKQANINSPIIFHLLKDGNTYFIHITFNSNLTIAYSILKATYLCSGDYYNQFLMLNNIKDSELQVVLEEMKKLCQECYLSRQTIGDKPYVYKMDINTGINENMGKLSYIDELDRLDK